MGYDGLFFGRVDYQDKFNRAITKSMEMVWQGSPNNLGKDDKEKIFLIMQQCHFYNIGYTYI